MWLSEKQFGQGKTKTIFSGGMRGGFFSIILTVMQFSSPCAII
jgi:hypothetical protein